MAGQLRRELVVPLACRHNCTATQTRSILMARIVVLSDIHLSPTHGFFWDNWRIARDFANAAGAEAVVVNGDLAINGPDSDAELTFAASALAGLRGPVLPLPGNHDVGDEPPGQDANQIIDVVRLARWDRAFGRDRWTRNAGSWLLVGVNAQLFGSGLAREDAQNRWLDDRLAAAAGRPVALFLHKPIFLEEPREEPATAASIVPSARAGLLDRLGAGNVRLVVSGHLHEHRDRALNGTRHVWAPAVAFSARELHGGAAGCGLLVLDFSDDSVDITVEKPPGLVSHDLDAIKGHGQYKFLRDMPPCPPPAAG
jgi:3',5'-cyclic AMP phosphodiesterase CpdA